VGEGRDRGRVLRPGAEREHLGVGHVRRVGHAGVGVVPTGVGGVRGVVQAGLLVHGVQHVLAQIAPLLARAPWPELAGARPLVPVQGLGFRL